MIGKKHIFFHGDSSNIVARVKNDVHGCFISSVSEDIDIYLSRLYEINITSDKILHNRCLKISSKEQIIINKMIQKRQTIIKQIIKKSHFHMNLCEEYYRKIIEEFVAKLEIEMSKHLDELQKKMEETKEHVFIKSHDKIKLLSIKVENAKKEFLRRLESATKAKRQEILDQITNISIDKTRQPIGYEQLRELNLKMYSTVGVKPDGQGCVNIPERDKYIKDIKNVKQHGTPKKQFYSTTDLIQHSEIVNKINK
ncbi:unnamed protein product [Rotaria sp. Silwood1]|nr:unnamed protein product [Rotaria sp. Silwood1]CAF3904323.1 unnamed protein product [Rotaria sp. Silwood1]CAF4951362.1 unnamed protein product [Rotaria sp. Silwood1]